MMTSLQHRMFGALVTVEQNMDSIFFYSQSGLRVCVYTNRKWTSCETHVQMIIDNIETTNNADHCTSNVNGTNARSLSS